MLVVGLLNNKLCNSHAIDPSCFGKGKGKKRVLLNHSGPLIDINQPYSKEDEELNHMRILSN